MMHLGKTKTYVVRPWVLIRTAWPQQFVPASPVPSAVGVSIGNYNEYILVPSSSVIFISSFVRVFQLINGQQAETKHYSIVLFISFSR
jgi:hypothetical protein